MSRSQLATTAVMFQNSASVRSLRCLQIDVDRAVFMLEGRLEGVPFAGTGLVEAFYSVPPRRARVGEYALHH